jgi:dCMP deaminase
MVNYYMQIAEQTAQLSRARRLQVGCVIVKNDNIISFGWNGTPPGWDNDCEYRVWDTGAGGWLSPEEIETRYPYEDYHPEAQRQVRYGLKTKPEVIHAEANALMKLCRTHESSQGADLFLTHAPCIDCAKLIASSGINSVYYRNQYRNQNGIDFLSQSQIDCQKV